jgi:hypothetical protein
MAIPTVGSTEAYSSTCPAGKFAIKHIQRCTNPCAHSHVYLARKIKQFAKTRQPMCTPGNSNLLLPTAWPDGHGQDVSKGQLQLVLYLLWISKPLSWSLRETVVYEWVFPREFNMKQNLKTNLRFLTLH